MRRGALTVARAGLSGLGDLASQAAGRGLAILPRQRRFAAARALARALEPAWRARLLYSVRIDGYREQALIDILGGMFRLGIEFDPLLRVTGAEEIRPGPAIFVSGHFRLNSLFARWLHDRGRAVTVVMKGPASLPYVVGTRAPLDAVLTGPRSVFQLRRRLEAGGTAVVLVDRAEPRPGWRRADTAVGPRYLSNVVFRLGASLQVPVYFCATLIDAAGQVITDVALPSTQDPAVALEEFGRYLQHQVVLVRRSTIRRR